MTDTYELEIDVEAPRERVWQALTTSAELEQWFCEHADVDLDAKRFDFWGRYTQGNPSREDGDGRITDYVPGERLQFEWVWRGSASVVTISLRGSTTTTVHVLHEGVATRRSEGGLHPRHLWADALVHLRGYLELGTTGPRFDYTWPHMGGFRVEADLAAPREAVWRMIGPDGWQSPDNPRVRPARDETEDFSFDVGHLVGIRVLEVDPPSRYELAWIDPRPTVLTYTFDDREGGTHITLVHSGFDADEDVLGMAEGFFSGIVEMAWRIATNGAWPRRVPIVNNGVTQSNGTLGVRVLQSA